MAIEKRYQVFVSSTFLDLKVERHEVIKAILQMNHLPAGMELFPATDGAAWELIQKVIDSSDFYVLIVGGRYGAEDADGIGFTEREYDYARARGIPILAFLHENPESLQRNRTESSEAAWDKLKRFRDKIDSQHHRRTWNDPSGLAAQVVLGLTHAISENKSIGWVRADQVPAGATMTEILKLQEENARLREQFEQARTTPPPGTEDLLQGSDDLSYPVAAYFRDDFFSVDASISVDIAFGSIAPSLIGEAGELTLRQMIEDTLLTAGRIALSQKYGIDAVNFEPIRTTKVAVDSVIVQLRALGLIGLGSRKRSLSDTEVYWSLTPYGDYLMTRLMAKKKSAPR